MEDTNGDTKETTEERLGEKIVYKVVHVPYYYPVPVDAEWYYKNYDRFSNQDEHFFDPEHPRFQHLIPPPPGFPFPKRRVLREEQEHRIIYSDPYDLPDVQMRSMSPIRNRMSPKEAIRLQMSPRKPTEYVSSPDLSEGEDEGEEVKKEGVKEQPSEIEGKKNKGHRKNIGERSDCDDACKNEDVHRENCVEVNRNRKRYLMTFPYDQKKKHKSTELGKEERRYEHTEKRYFKDEDDLCDVRYKPKRFYEERKYCNKQATVSSKHNDFPVYPHVLVPTKDSSYYPTKMAYKPRYERSDNTSYEIYRSEGGDVHDKTEEEDNESHREIRFHPNGRRARTVFTRQQLLTLNNVFDKHPFVSGERMSELSDQLGLDRKIVKIWFQNKRQYARKKGSSLDRENEYYYDYRAEQYHQPPAPAPTMAEQWKN